MSTRGSRWLQTVLWTSCGLVLVGLGGTAWWASVSASERESLEHELVAERVIDEVERELSARLLTDEARPFHQWRHRYLPAGAVDGAVPMRSPLSWDEQGSDGVLGWFQLEPGGEVVSPRRPNEGAVPVAVSEHEQDLARWTADLPKPELGGDRVAVRSAGLFRRARTVLHRVRTPQPASDAVTDLGDGPAPVQEPEVPELAQVKPEPSQQIQSAPLEYEQAPVYTKSSGWAKQRKALNINRGADLRQRRSGKSEEISDLQISNYVNPGNVDNGAYIQQQVVQQQVVQQLVEQPVDPQVEPDLGTQNARIAGDDQANTDEAAPLENKVPDGATLAVPEAPQYLTETVYDEVVAPLARRAPLEVQIDPFDVREGPDGVLLQHRTVHIGGQTWVQGAVISQRQMQEHVTASVLSALPTDAPAVALSWAGESGPHDAVYSFPSALAPPFEELSPTVHLPRIPGTGGGQGPVWLAAGLAALVLLVGTALTSSMLAARLRLAEARSDFASAITHELRTPLTTIRMYVEMLEQGVVQDEAGRQRYLGTVRQEAERLGRMVEDVLAFARLDRGRRLPVGRAGTLGAAMDEAMAMAAPSAAAAGCDLVVHVQPEARAFVTDVDAIVQVLHNLIDNGVKFGAVAEQPRVQVSVDREADGVQLVVRDAGPGVEPRVQRRMFDAFVRGERELTRSTRGTGIGLALVKARVEGLGGTVTATNHAEGGLQVVVRLPAGSIDG